MAEYGLASKWEEKECLAIINSRTLALIYTFHKSMSYPAQTLMDVGVVA